MFCPDFAFFAHSSGILKPAVKHVPNLMTRDVLQNWVCPIGLLSRIKLNFTHSWGFSSGSFNSSYGSMNIKFSRSLFNILHHFQKSVLYMKLKIILIRKCMQMFQYHLNAWAAREWYYITGYTEATESSPLVSRDDVTFHSAILAFPSNQPWFMPTGPKRF